MTTITKNIIHKLESLPQGMLKQVEDFIDLLKKTSEQKNTVKKQSRDSIYGAAEGFFIIPDDFNEPLEDLKDYM